MKTTYKIVGDKLEQVDKQGNFPEYNCVMLPKKPKKLKSKTVTMEIIGLIGLIGCPHCLPCDRPSEGEDSFSA